jgi:hypothetical protein
MTFTQFVAGAYVLVWLSAFVGKIDGWRDWRRTIDALIRSPRVRRAATVGVPSVEFASAILLVLAPRAGLWASAALLLLLAAAVLALTHRHEGEDCGCFGALAPATISARLAVRNVALTAPAALAVLSAGTVEPLPAVELLGLTVIAVTGLLASEAWALRSIAIPISNEETAA